MKRAKCTMSHEEVPTEGLKAKHVNRLDSLHQSLVEDFLIAVTIAMVAICQTLQLSKQMALMPEPQPKPELTRPDERDVQRREDDTR